MIINKDNVTDYQVSHIDSTHEERLEVCRILESFGQEVSSTTSFKHTTTISKLFNRDIFHLDGSTYSLVSVKPYLLITIIVVNTISVIVSTNLIVSLVDGFGACVVGYILYKDHIRNLK